MSIEGQGHFFTIYFPGFVCFVLYLRQDITLSGERLQDQWSSGLHLAYDQLTGIVRCLNSHFRTISVRISYIFLGRRRVVVASTILFNSELYKKFKIVET